MLQGVSYTTPPAKRPILRKQGHQFTGQNLVMKYGAERRKNAGSGTGKSCIHGTYNVVEKSSIKSFWLLNMAMDNGPCVDIFFHDVPIENGIGVGTSRTHDLTRWIQPYLLTKYVWGMIWGLSPMSGKIDLQGSMSERTKWP